MRVGFRCTAAFRATYWWHHAESERSAKKGSQVHGGGVVLDLRQTSVTAADLGDIMARVSNSTSQVSDVVVLP